MKGEMYYNNDARRWESEPEYDEDNWEDYDGPYPEDDVQIPWDGPF